MKVYISFGQSSNGLVLSKIVDPNNTRWPTARKHIRALEKRLGYKHSDPGGYYEYYDLQIFDKPKENTELNKWYELTPNGVVEIAPKRVNELRKL